MTRKPDECLNMTELRAEIDRIDVELISKLGERAGYIQRAVEIKHREGLPAYIKERIDQVINNVRDKANEQGLDPVLAETLWREIVEWSCRYEAGYLKNKY